MYALKSVLLLALANRALSFEPRVRGVNLGGWLGTFPASGHHQQLLFIVSPIRRGDGFTLLSFAIRAGLGMLSL